MRPRDLHQLGVPAADPVADYREFPALVVLTQEALVASTTPESGIDYHLVPLLELLLLRRDRLHRARDVAPGDVRQRDFHVGEPVPGPDVQMVQGTRIHPDQSLVRVGHRVWGLFVLKHLWASV